MRKATVSRTHQALLRVASLVAVVALMGGCTINTFNCNVKDACRPGAPGPASAATASGSGSTP